MEMRKKTKSAVSLLRFSERLLHTYIERALIEGDGFLVYCTYCRLERAVYEIWL